jgi:hypothetical protein
MLNQTQNCSALYGPGIISSLFSWELFDAVAFLIEFNNGYPMTIPDMALAFHNVDHSIPGDGSNASALIDCGIQTHPGQMGSHKRMIDPAAIARPVISLLSMGYDCPKANFTLKRQKIMLPIINQTADVVYNQLIPAPGGDCKLLIDGPDGLSLPRYNTASYRRSGQHDCCTKQISHALPSRTRHDWYL